ncbi:MAG: sulfatase family protein, partial [Rubripirellula sp.]
MNNYSDSYTLPMMSTPTLAAASCFLSGFAALLYLPPISVAAEPTTHDIDARPNIVVLIADDWSWPHASVLGSKAIKTPNFDRVANEGTLFENAFVSTPSCTPSRLSILTGQHHWRLQEGDSLGGSLRESFPVYTELLQQSGYQIGRYGKGVWPSKHTFRNRDSFGERYRSFDDFLKQRKAGQPFCFWYGGQDPHRPYETGIGQKTGINLADIQVPACLPDNSIVRNDLADYMAEVQRFDKEVGDIIQRLEAMNELDNTIVVVTSDNGMPFPRCKATLYDMGTRVPLAIRWGKAQPHTVTDIVSLCDLAPTFLNAANTGVPQQMTGKTLLSQLKAEQNGQIDPDRTFALSGLEKHVYSYPARSLRTANFLYISNGNPADWETGVVEGHNPEYDFSKTPWPTEPGAFSYNIDPSPTKQFLRLNAETADQYANLAFSQKP